MRVSIFAAALLLPATGHAQGKLLAQDSCFAAVGATALTRVPIFLEASGDLMALPFLPSADVFAQSVAMKMREMLGGKASELPPADSAIRWPRLWGEMIVTAHRDKPMTWRLAPWWKPGSDTISRSSLAFLRRAIEKAAADGESIPITENFQGDSISFRLALLHPDVERGGKVVPLTLRLGIAAFSLALPWGKPVEIIGKPLIEYPSAARGQPFINSVRLAFIVNRKGRAVPESIREIWPANVPFPTGPQLFAYRALVRAVKSGLPTARFSPASIAGCPVDQVVTQEFQFRIPDPSDSVRR